MQTSNRMPVAFIVLIIAALPSVVRSHCCIAQDHTSPELGPSYGTVNILLANQNGLVAVTDSMLTYTLTNEHKPIGTKLFKIDDHTICMMAGQYAAPVPWSGGDSLQFLVPQVMDQFIKKNIAGNTLEQKASAIAGLFEYDFSGILIHRSSMGIDISKDEPLYLTLAGYDPDGSLKVAEIKLEASKAANIIAATAIKRERRPTGFIPCALAIGFQHVAVLTAERNVQIRKISKPLFCETAGIDSVAQNILENPKKYPHLPGVPDYLNSLDQDSSLSIDQLKTLATTLAGEVARDESRSKQFRVGGSVQVALLANGTIKSFEKNPEANEPSSQSLGSRRNAAQIQGISWKCTTPQSRPFTVTHPGMMSMSVHLVDCNQELDEYDFHDSTFENSHLLLNDKEPQFIFDQKNTVIGSTLALNPGINLEVPSIKNLVCGFNWKSVTQSDADIKTRLCPPH